MAGWNGSGTFSRSHDWTEDQGNGVKIRADRHDDNDVDFVSGINNCMTKDGQNAATANLDMGSNKLTMGATATAVGDFPIVSDIQNAVHTYVTSTGSANAYLIALTPAPAAYAAGQPFRFKANFANTGAATINVNSLGAKDLKRYGSIPLVTGEIRVDQIVTVVYDGTQFQTISINDVPVPVASKFGAFLVQNTADDGYELLSGQGTGGQVMTSNGPDALASFQAATGWQTVKDITISSDVTIEFEDGVDGVDLASFDEYQITVQNFIPSDDNRNLNMNLSVDGGSTSLSSLYHLQRSNTGATTYSAIASSGAADIPIFSGVGTSTGENGSSVISLGNINSSTYKVITIDGGLFAASAAGETQSGIAIAPSTSVIDSITFSTNATNMASGRLILQARSF